ncbi:hypothetical protein IF2G_05822 [Cordyceps javanica]|nr:hypothetical protein IF2G_05822 [Cordyceps javanica]
MQTRRYSFNCAPGYCARGNYVSTIVSEVAKSRVVRTTATNGETRSSGNVYVKNNSAFEGKHIFDELLQLRRQLH